MSVKFLKEVKSIIYRRKGHELIHVGNIPDDVFTDSDLENQANHINPNFDVSYRSNQAEIDAIAAKVAALNAQSFKIEEDLDIIASENEILEKNKAFQSIRQFFMKNSAPTIQTNNIYSNLDDVVYQHPHSISGDPVTAYLPPEKLVVQVKLLKRAIDTDKKEGIYSIEALMKKLSYGHSPAIHSFHPQAVLMTAAEEGCIIWEYKGNKPEYQGCFQANGYIVKAQKEVVDAIRASPRVITFDERTLEKVKK